MTNGRDCATVRLRRSPILKRSFPSLFPPRLNFEEISGCVFPATSACRVACGCVAAAHGGQLRADDEEKPAAKADKATREKAPPTEVTTPGAVDVGGQHIAYNAVVGTLTVGATDAQDAQLGLDGKPLPGSQLANSEPKEPKDASPTARMFYVAYFKKDAKAEDRPITFFYNGGPGSSTVWLHMGSLGPKHVVTSGDQHLPAAPYTLVDNANSLLDVSDLVFIDMPGTGFGRLMGKDAEKAFWGVDEDANAFARFIAAVHHQVQPLEFAQVHLRRELRHDALGGAGRHSGKRQEHRSEWRDSAVADLQLHDRYRCGRAPIPAWICPMSWRCPPIAATAWYHKKLPQQPPALEPFLKEVEDFAMGPYAHALALGTDLSATRRSSRWPRSCTTTPGCRWPICSRPICA